jgi:hypothetical protein
MCGGVFEKGRSDEEAMKEMTDILGPIPSDEPIDIVCDDCFNIINPRGNPEIVEECKREFRKRIN